MTADQALARGPLSASLRHRAAAAHATAEHSPYLAALAAGRVTAAGVAALLGRLAPVYAALEGAAAQWAGDPVVGRFLLPGLARTGRLQADLVHLTGGTQLPDSPAAQAYAARVDAVARASAAGFVAHHYTRSLADLSGGQVLRVAVERSFGLSDGHGASFFAFPSVRPGPAKAAYRRHLDEAPFTQEQREQVVAETLEAYRLNVALTAELDADLPRWTAG